MLIRQATKTLCKGHSFCHIRICFCLLAMKRANMILIWYFQLFWKYKCIMYAYSRMHCHKGKYSKYNIYEFSASADKYQHYTKSLKNTFLFESFKNVFVDIQFNESRLLLCFPTYKTRILTRQSLGEF